MTVRRMLTVVVVLVAVSAAAGIWWVTRDPCGDPPGPPYVDTEKILWTGRDGRHCEADPQIGEVRP